MVITQENENKKISLDEKQYLPKPFNVIWKLFKKVSGIGFFMQGFAVFRKLMWK